MTPEKKAQIRKRITIIEIALMAVLLAYLGYGIATKTTDQPMFNALAIFVIAAYLILNDFVEPYLTKMIAEMDSFRKEAYKKYVLWDIASMGGVLLFVLNFSKVGSAMTYVGLGLYFIGNKQKNAYRPAYLGKVTKEDVEAAKKAVVDVEAVEIEDAEEVQEAVETVEE